MPEPILYSIMETFNNPLRFGCSLNARVCVCVCAEKKLSSWKLIGDRSNEINRRGFYEITCETKYELGILSFFILERVYDVEN